MTSYIIIPRSGLMLGLLFFLGFSVVLGGIVYVFLTRPLSRRPELGAWTVRAPVAMTVGALIAVGVFSGIYASAIAGFDRVAIGDGTIRIDYPVLGRSVTVPAADIAGVERPFAHKGRWRVIIRTRDGRTIESAPGAPAPVRLAAEALAREVDRAVRVGQR